MYNKTESALRHQREMGQNERDKLEFLKGKYRMKVTIEDLEAYLLDHYKEGGIDESLFMKLVEEVGEVAEVLNKRAGRKAYGNEDLKNQLGNELADVIHYALAIAALNGIDMNQFIIEKDKAACVKYEHEVNLEQFISERRKNTLDL